MEADEQFGICRHPSYIDHWEKYKPASLMMLDIQSASALVTYGELAKSPLFSHSAKSKTFIWALSQSCEVWLAIEEIAPVGPFKGFSGYPRRRKLTVRAEKKKLGHPTLVPSDGVRMAGELFLDIGSKGPQWFINASSGRYCRDHPPTQQQTEYAAGLFRSFNIDVLVDDDF